ncbi:MAG: hypothetical protein JST75_14530 [Bacteroidetes bacterium]|nr:hypothetical protein [Bacteroidota bacterium]
MKKYFLKSMTMSFVGLILLLPASYFMMTLLAHIFFGSTTLYYAIAPSFMESGSDLIPFHKTAWILYGPLFAVLLIAPTILKFRFHISTMQLQVKFFFTKYWLNTAIVFQSALLFITMVIYLLIQHYRY